MPPNVLHLSTYDTNGGAARAAYALHRAMLESGISSRMLVATKTVDDATVTAGSLKRFQMASLLDRQLWRVQTSSVATWHSPARFGSLSAAAINASRADVVNLHWVTDGFLSIREIGRITKPVVWSLYDMWPFTGTEHYGADAPDARWRTGYSSSNRMPGDGGIDLDRLTWTAKRKHWTRPMHIVPASSWLEDRVLSSALMRDWPVTRIPHVVDAVRFTPDEVSEARQRLGLPSSVPLILFLASAGITDERKGFDLLEKALPAVRDRHPDVRLVVVGPAAEGYESPSGVPVVWQGTVDGNDVLRDLYLAADVTAVPSREDNMPLTAMESTTSGTPVVAFRIGGLPDIVAHQETGYLADPFDLAQLAEGLIHAIDDSQHERSWATAARQRALRTWSSPVVAAQYADLYSEVIP